MDFDLNEDQRLLAKTVADYGKKDSPVERFRKLRDADGPGWEKSTWKQMGELGWLAVPFPESVGGFGGSFVDAAIILEALGRTLVPEPFIESVVLGGYAITLAGTPEQAERFLAPMLEGDGSLALAHHERSLRFDTRRAETTATADGDGFVLQGQKDFVLNGAAADLLVVSASAPDGLSLFVVDADADGLERRSTTLIDGRRAAKVTLDGVRVQKDAHLSAAPASEVLARVMDYGAAATVAEGLGVASAMLAMTTEYLKTRQQFDVPIGSFQALQHRAADMFIETELLRSLSMEATARVDDPDDPERQAAISAAKYQLATGGQFVSRQAIQLHGGVGVTDEHDVGLYFKRMHALATLCGDEAHHTERFATLT